MFALFKAKRHGMRRLLGLNTLSWKPPGKMPVRRRVLDDYRPQECELIAQRWDALAEQATSDEERVLRERLAREWRTMV